MLFWTYNLRFFDFMTSNNLKVIVLSYTSNVLVKVETMKQNAFQNVLFHLTSLHCCIIAVESIRENCMLCSDVFYLISNDYIIM